MASWKKSVFIFTSLFIQLEIVSQETCEEVIVK